MPRAIYTEAHSRLWLDVATALARDLDLQPVYWVGKQVFEPSVRDRFPGVVFHPRTLAIRGVAAPSLANAPERPLDAAVLSRFSHPLIVAGKMLDRLDPAEGFRYEERTRLAQVQLRYWRTVVERFEPDLVFFPVQPHTVYDYLLYEVCKAHGVRTVMFQWTLFHDWIFPLDDIRDGYGELSDRYDHLLTNGKVPLSARVEAYLDRVSGDYRTAVPDYLVRQMPSDLRQSLFGRGRRVPSGDFSVLDEHAASRVTMVEDAAKDAPGLPPLRWFVSQPRRAWKHVRRYAGHRRNVARKQLRHARGAAHRTAIRTGRGVARRFSPAAVQRTVRRGVDWPRRARKAAWRSYKRWFRHVLRAILQGDVDRPLKEPGRRIEESFRGRWGAVRLQYWRFRGARKKRDLLRYYLERCAPLDFSAPYIFVALHYQPEQTPSPTGGVFVDQALMVDMLARLAPPGWRIYVKEHPFQFFANGVGERSRTTDLYDDLLAIPNVTLVPWSVSPFELIDGARAVATVTGTTGIEAAMRGKPVLAFGYAWYRDCEGVFYTPSVETCRAALDRIAAGYTVDREKVRTYLRAVEDVCFRADLNFGERIDPIPHEENVARLSAAIVRLFTRADRAA